MSFTGETVCWDYLIKNFFTICILIIRNNRCNQWRLVAFINGGASKTIIEMSKSSIRRLPKFKGGVNKFLAKIAISLSQYRYCSIR